MLNLLDLFYIFVYYKKARMELPENGNGEGLTILHGTEASEK